MNVSIIGLGKLGAPMAAVFAARGHHVIGLDVNPIFLEKLAAGKAPIEEPRLQEMLDAGRDRLRVTSSHEELVANSEITFIIVPTPSDWSGAFSNDYVLAAVEQLGKALRAKSRYHVVVVTSTVMPGSMDGPIREMLERSAGRRVGDDVGLCYNPEFIALGSVVNNMLEPDFLLIGESDERAGGVVAAVYETVCPNHPPAKRMNFINAELAKISVNTFVTTKISYANMLADLCDPCRVPMSTPWPMPSGPTAASVGNICAAPSATEGPASLETTSPSLCSLSASGRAPTWQGRPTPSTAIRSIGWPRRSRRACPAVHALRSSGCRINPIPW